jgi:hypothetical protein
LRYVLRHWDGVVVEEGRAPIPKTLTCQSRPASPVRLYELALTEPGIS